MSAIKKHGSYAYNKHKCRCDVCREAKARNTKAYADRLRASKPAPISHARDLRILTLAKPVAAPTFTATPVDDCGEPIAPGHWCRRPYPCTEHGDMS